MYPSVNNKNKNKIKKGIGSINIKAGTNHLFLGQVTKDNSAF